VHDAAHRAGQVTAQSVAAGSRVGAGSTVSLTVASGPRTVTVDPQAYVGQPAATVVAALTAKGLVVRTATVNTDAVKAGGVVAVTPSGALHEGSAVTVTIAAPPPPKHHEHGKDGGGHG
jgi:beta-lactam-binding protein with PASTA domain